MRALTPASQPPHTACPLPFPHRVAGLYTAVGVFRMGWLMKLLGHPVIGGFTSAAAITIALGQVCVCASRINGTGATARVMQEKGSAAAS